MVAESEGGQRASDSGSMFPPPTLQACTYNVYQEMNKHLGLACLPPLGKHGLWD